MISRPPIEAVRDTLAAIRSGGTFAVGLELPAEHLHVTVEGLGLLPRPRPEGTPAGRANPA